VITDIGKRRDLTNRRELTQQDLKVLSSIKGQSYDLVLNGVELGGGSIRVHDSAIQKSIFSLLGSYEQTELGRFTKKQPPPKTGAQGKIGSAKQQADGESADPVFGHLLTALEYGCPPHGGVAIGLDRTVATLGTVILQKQKDLQTVIPGQKTRPGKQNPLSIPDTVEPLSIRDVMAFPKSFTGKDLLVGSPSNVPQEALSRYHIRINKFKTDPQKSPTV